MPEARPLYELDHGRPWRQEDLAPLGLALAAAVLVTALLALLVEA